MELAVAVPVVVKVVEAPGRKLEKMEAPSSVNTSKNVTGAGTFGIGTAGPFTVAVPGMPTGKLVHGSEAPCDSIFEVSVEGK